MSTIKTLDVKVNGLPADQKYRFSFSNKGGNWPVRVSPLSGVFYPNSVKTYVYFCSTTGECPESDPNVFYNVPVSDPAIAGLDLDHKSLYSVLQLVVTEFDCDEVVYTYPCIVECDECIPKLSFNTDNISMTAADGLSKILNINIEGIIPNQSYSYQLDGAGGSWPVKITPRSGVIKTSETSYNVQALLEVCPSTGVCPSGHSSVLNYTTVPNNTSLLYSLVSMTVDPIDTFNTNYQSSSQSSFSVECDDCIPKLLASGPNVLELAQPVSAESFDVVLTNLMPNKQYSYTVQPTDANWPVILQPYSGTITSVSDIAIINMRATFCPTTGLCPTGTTNGLLPYTLADNSALSLGTIPKQARFRIKITDPCDHGTLDACSNQIGSSTLTYSNEIKVVCNNCIPQPQTSISSEVILNDSNTQTINATITNLIPGAEYKYLVKGLESNWPTLVYPYSGLIVANSETHFIPMTVSFCQSTGMCPNGTANIVPYTADTSYAANINLQTKNTKFRLEIDSVTYDFPNTYSNEVLAKCENCLPTLEVSIPTNTLLSDSNIYEFDATLNNTIPDQSYKFTFKSVDSNWPAIIYPESGTIVASSNSETLPVKLMFCGSTGVCANGMSNVLAYNADPSCLLNIGKLAKNVRLKMEVEQLGSNSSVINSNELHASCDDCISSTQVQATISEPDNVALINNSYSFVTNIDNLIPGESYKYVYKGINSNWPATVYPMSGIIKAVSSSFVIPTKVTLCTATGLCPSNTFNVIEYVNNDHCLIDDTTKNVNLVLEIQPANCSYSPVYSNQLNISCDNCIDQLFATIPTSARLSDSIDSYDINVNVGNMMVNRVYQYTFDSVDANWPVLVYPQSGTIRATSSTATIPATITFCPSTGVCPSGSPHVLSYNLEPECMIGFGGLDKYIRLKVDVKDIECEEVNASSNELRLSCVDCLHHVDVAHTGSLQVILTSGNGPDFAYELGTSVSGLIPGESYRYNVNYVDSNWPCIISRQSGEFTATTDHKTIKTNIGFCLPSGSCASYDDAILTYTPNAVYDKMDQKFITVNVSLDALDCSVPRVYSDDFTLFCKGCTPMNMNALSVKFSGAPSVIYSGCVCSGNQLALVNVSNALSNTNYDYTFTSSSNKITFSPASGTAVFGSSGSGTIMSVMDMSFSSGDIAVVQMKLHDSMNNIDAMDQLAIECQDKSCAPLNMLSVQFSGSPSIIYSGCACSGNTELALVSVTGASPYTDYNYTFTSSSNKLTFSPSSGTIAFGSAGVGTIMSVMGLSFGSGDISVVQIKLDDTVTGTEAMDQLVVQCQDVCN
jgi:hypothetical protein